MAEKRAKRRLAAILAADVVGYSRMMRENEAGTLAQLKTHRIEVFDPRIAEHNGRIVKTTGDGVLVEFASAVDATECAIKIQRALARRNEDVPEGHRIELRIGINLGDIIVDGDDIYGDGVNVAARLEALCDTGEVYVSAVVHDQVDGKIDMAFEDLGEHTVKNIDKPIRVYRVSPEVGPSVTATTAANPDQSLPLPDKPSIAVLPFENMSGDPEQEYFADGISEDVITDLSKVSGLFVIARNSSFAYRGKSTDVRNVCRDLGVRYILEGSVRKVGNRVRINAQLVKGTTGEQIWAERYDRDLADIFAVQDEVTREIVNALQVTLTEDEQTRRMRRRKVDPEAYDLMVRARELLFQLNASALAESRTLLDRAINLDPDMAAAHALLSLLHCPEYLNGWNDPAPDHLERAVEIAERACRIDPEEPQAHHALAIANLWLEQFEAAERAADRAVEPNPNFAGGYTALGQVRDMMGLHESAIDCAEKGLSLDPHYDLALQVLGRAQFALGRDDEAAANFERRLVKVPKSDTSRAFLAAIYGFAGRREEAHQRWREIMEINPDFSVAHLRRVLSYKSPAVLDRLAAGLGKAGLPE